MRSSIKTHVLRRIPQIILGLFVVGLLSFSILHATPELPSKNRPHCFYSNQSRDNLTSLYKKAIKDSKKTIYIAIYGLTDPSIIEALNLKAEEGLDITIFYDYKASSHLEKKLDPRIHQIPHKGHGLMHRKILVTDHKRIFIGSANLTPSSLKYHANLVIGIYSPYLATCLEQNNRRQCDCMIPIGPVSLELLPDHNDQSLNKLKECIRLSEKTCYVAMFTFTHPILTKELMAAKERGIDVRVIIDGSTSQGASASTYAKLKDAGIQVMQSRGPELMHHKWIWIDHKHLILGSTNWTRSAFKKNHDCFLMIRDIDLPSQTKLDSIWNQLEIETR